MLEAGTGASAEIQDEDMETDVAALAGPAAGRQDALANLEQSLRPVERYAIRYLEEVKHCFSPCMESVMSTVNALTSHSINSITLPMEYDVKAGVKVTEILHCLAAARGLYWWA